MRGPRRGPVWAAQLWLQQRRRRWRTRRERHTERSLRRRTDERADRRPGWRYHRGVQWAILTAAGLLVAWTLFSLVVTIADNEPGFLPISRWCAGSQPRAYYCGEVEGFVKGPLLVALGLAVFFFWRYAPVRRWYRRNVLRNPPASTTAPSGCVRCRRRETNCPTRWTRCSAPTRSISSGPGSAPPPRRRGRRSTGTTCGPSGGRCRNGWPPPGASEGTRHPAPKADPDSARGGSRISHLRRMRPLESQREYSICFVLFGH
ncbi:hypothetical protein GA0070617_2723 [Micromonospora yangpuensis]|uniref:Uncharacterized protein n=1 Tax=Micromonospora yangpuensis TaxID=683228 RepID=A0A1C6UKP8_9ACTN|nr:hypothetical protein GA0070617_2723 [Micromonospora yangpuensis]